MANRRFGNGGGRGGGGLNRNFNSSNISPWQGGAPPGNPSSNLQNQIALALTSLIQQTNQQGPPDGPPSLLNMNTSPGYFNQDQNRFVNRGRQDFRRSEPYNKNRGGTNFGSGNRNNRGNNFSNKKFKDNKGKKAVEAKTPAKGEKQEKAADTTADESIKEDEEETKGEDGKRIPKPTKYDGLPNGLLHCFVCNKSMWDGESFRNHLGGKAHKQMIVSLEESFQITVNILRENMRLCEGRKMIEYERMQRSRRYHHNNAQEPESHCNMCDLKFMGKIVVHRQTEGHQRLKRFLHPKCKRCALEFPTRMEWVDHQFVPEHLFKLKEYLESKDLQPGEYKVKVQVEVDNEPLLEENVQNEDDNPVTELSEDLNNLFNRIPVYKAERAISKESLKPANGFICDLCNLFMPTEEESQAHLKSYGHYGAFVEEVKQKYQKAQNDKKRKAEEEAAAAEGEKKDGEESKDDAEMDQLLDDDAEGGDADEKPKAADVSKTESVDEAKVIEVKDEEEDLEEEEEEEEEKEKPKIVVEEKKTPATRAKRGGGNVRNGAGPKTKKQRL